MTVDSDLGLSKTEKLLQELGYRAQVERETRSIASATGGLNFSIALTGQDILQFSCGVEMGDRKFTLDHANEFNRSYRFSKLFLEGESDVVLMSDYIVDFEQSAADDQLKHVIGLWEGSISLFKEFLVKVADDES